MNRTRKFMGVALEERSGGDVGFPCYTSKPWPIVTIGQANDGTWFAMFQPATRGVNFFTITRRASYRSACGALAAIVRSLRDELGKMK